MVALGMNEEKATEVQLAEMKLEDGTMVEAEEFQAGQAVFVITEDKEKMAMPEGSYSLEDGKVMVVDESGVIAEIVEPASEEEAPAEAPAEAAVEEVEATNEGEAAPKKVVESETISRETFFAEMEKMKSEFAAQLDAYKEEVANLTSQKEQAELMLSTAEKDLQEVQAKLSEEPASTGMSHSPEGNGEPRAKMRFGQNGAQNTTSRVFERIANIKNK